MLQITPLPFTQRFFFSSDIFKNTNSTVTKIELKQPFSFAARFYFKTFFMKTKTKIKLFIGTFVLCIIAAIIFNSCGKSSGSNSSNTNAAGTTANTVVIKNFAFSPASLTVTKGTKVTWVNNDGPAHTVTATDNGNTFNSGTIAPAGGTYSFTFTTAGDFNYKCSIHPQMLGIVHVQ